jgi:hypothetical protein
MLFDRFRRDKPVADARVLELGTGRAWELVYTAGERLQGDPDVTGTPVRRYVAEFIGGCFRHIADRAVSSEAAQESMPVSVGAMAYLVGHQMRQEHGDAMLAGTDVPGAPAVPDAAWAAQNAKDMVQNAMTAAYNEKLQ